MQDDAPKALIVRPTSGLQQHDSGAGNVLSRIVSDALTIARGRDVADTSARIRVGKYEFREQDYRQILIWAQEGGKTPEDIVSFLEDADNNNNEEDSFLVDDGAIKHLTLPDPKQFEFLRRRLQISHLPNLTKLWCSSRQLAKLQFVCKSALEKLDCHGTQLTELDLSNVSALTALRCGGNRLTEPDLSNVPALTHLSCYENQLTELGVSNSPALTTLICSRNQLTELDLSNVPALWRLWCHKNQLTELDLSDAPALTHLWCHENQLTELDLSNVSALTWLYCNKNQLTELDLSNVPKLTELSCSENKLTKLDLSNAPELTMLDFGDNELTELDLSKLRALTDLCCAYNHLTELDLSNVPALTRLRCGKNQLTELDLSNVPALTGLHCENNRINELDVRRNPNLKVLKCDPWVRIIKHGWQSFSGFCETDTNIDRVTVPSLSYEGKVWTIALNGEKTKLAKANEDGDSESISTMRVVVLDYATRRGRALYLTPEGRPSVFNPDKPGKPACWSDDGITPHASVATPQRYKCDGCPWGYKTSDNGKSVAACSQHRMVACVPANKLGFTPLQLKLSMTSDWDGESPELAAQGWFAFSNFILQKGASHTAAFVTKMRFDPNVTWPKVMFAHDRRLTGAELAVIRPIVKSDEVKSLLAGTWTPTGADGVKPVG